MEQDPSTKRKTLDEMLKLVERFPVKGREYPVISTEGSWIDGTQYLRRRVAETQRHPGRWY